MNGWFFSQFINSLNFPVAIKALITKLHQLIRALDEPIRVF